MIVSSRTDTIDMISEVTVHQFFPGTQQREADATKWWRTFFTVPFRHDASSSFSHAADSLWLLL